MGNFRKHKTRKGKPVLNIQRNNLGNFPYEKPEFPSPPPVGGGNRKLFDEETFFQSMIFTI